MKHHRLLLLGLLLLVGACSSQPTFPAVSQRVVPAITSFRLQQVPGKQPFQLQPTQPNSLASDSTKPAVRAGWVQQKVSPDGRRLAVIDDTQQIRLFDLHAWPSETQGPRLSGFVNDLAFSADSQSLYWAAPTRTDSAHGMPREYWLQRFTPGGEPQPLLALPPTFIPQALRIIGQRAILYGQATSNDNLAEDLPQLLFIDLERAQIATELRLAGLQAGQFTQKVMPDQNPYRMLIPGLAWDLPRQRLYIAHAASDTVTVVDLAQASIRQTTQITPRAGLLEWVVGLGARSAAAKMVPGVRRTLALSPDGTRLYLSGTRSELIEDQQRSLWREVPLGLLIVSTADLSEVQRLTLPVSELALSPDGNTLLLTGIQSESRANDQNPPSNRPSGLYVFDTATLTIRAHLEPNIHFGLRGFSANGRFGYVTHHESTTGIARVLDLTTNTFTSRQELGPHGEIINLLDSPAQ
jgi:DNA-binding beta-propeller fold protein YncE